MKITIFAVNEAAKECGVAQEAILQFIEDEWVEPFDQYKLSLDQEDVERIKLIKELKGLGVNDEAVPIILHLIDQINALHWGLRQGLNH
jgi:DNA-binding transcriptional MerR regulator